MNKEKIIFIGLDLLDILRNDSDEFEVIEKFYKFWGQDHDLWEFESIIKRLEDDKYFSVHWFDSYVGWGDCGLDDELFIATEVFPVEVKTISYE